MNAVAEGFGDTTGVTEELSFYSDAVGCVLGSTPSLVDAVVRPAIGV